MPRPLYSPTCLFRFCCVVVRERFPADLGPMIPGHTLTLVPALRLENLLPMEMHFRAAPPDEAAAPRANGTLPPADTRSFHEVPRPSGEFSLHSSLQRSGITTSRCIFLR